MGGGSGTNTAQRQDGDIPDAGSLRAHAEFIVSHSAEIKTRTVSSVTVSATSNPSHSIQSAEVQIPSDGRQDNKMKAFYQALGEIAGLGKLTPSILESIQGDPANPYFKAEGNLAGSDIKKKLVNAAQKLSDMSAQEMEAFTKKVQENLAQLEAPAAIMQAETSYGGSIVSTVNKQGSDKQLPVIDPKLLTAIDQYHKRSFIDQSNEMASSDPFKNKPPETPGQAGGKTRSTGIFT